MVKALPAVRQSVASVPGREDPLGQGLLPSPVILPGEFHGQRNLVGYS